MKWTVSFQGTKKWGKRLKKNYKIKKKSKDETNRKYLTGWGHKVTPDGHEKAWTGLGLYGLADRIHCMSGQAEHL